MSKVEKRSFYSLDVRDVAEHFKTDLESGLSQEEAQRRIEEYGKNLLERKSRKSVVAIFFDQFVNPIVWILIAAAVAAFSFKHYLEGMAVVVVILVNAFIGFFMELQAVKSMRKLREMSRARAEVVRDGHRIDIDSADIVPGDILFVEAGDMITADARVIASNNIAINESALTGESTQVDKSIDQLPDNAPVADRNNSLFQGTLVTRGNGKAIVTATGNSTELGTISDLAQAAEKAATPFDKRLNILSRKLVWLTLGIAVGIFIIGFLRGRDWLIMIETAIALAVAAIPEGLPVIATITLARGMLRLASKNAVVKTLEAVQTLGETNVILTDKTGTLTENKMTLSSFILNDGTIEFPPNPGNIDERTSKILEIGALCNDSTFNKSDPEKTTGDPIEIALLEAASDGLDSYETLFKEYPRVAEIPFDSELKMMATLHKKGSGFLVGVKGACEVVLNNCTHVLNKAGEPESITDKDRWLEQVDQCGKNGLRVLAFAYKEADDQPEEKEFISDLIFIGLAAFLDPARKEVIPAIQTCKEAGIKVVMVTGDHPETASNIAQQVGLIDIDEIDNRIIGKDLEQHFVQNEQASEKFLKARVFARINPSQKLDIVEYYQKNNSIVGMTGDGVNDAPALKKADIGIAMGKRGTEVAKEASDIVLKDDSFNSIVLAIEQGRNIFENIRKFVVYLLSCNLSEIMVVAVASIFNMPLPLLPLQILFLNMVTDVFPALALGMNKGEKGIMKKPPRDPKEPIINRELWLAIISYGISMTVAVIGIELVAIYLLNAEKEVINNMTFYTLILVQLWNVFNLPERGVSFFVNQVTKNKYVWLAFLICGLIIGITWLIEPAREALSLVPVKLDYWGLIVLFSFTPILIVQVLKRLLKVIK